MPKPPTIPPFVNRSMEFLLRSPMHGMLSQSLLLISFTGRVSGKTFTTPVGYSQCGDQVYIFSHNKWWKNLEGGAPVSLRIRGQDLQGLAEPVSRDKQAIAAGLSAHLRKVPSDARYYDVTFDENGEPRQDEVERAAQSVVMILVSLRLPQEALIHNN